MANPIKRGQAGGQVSDFGSSQSAAAFVSSITPYGLKLQQVITSTGSVTIPTGINFVYAICVGGGTGGTFNYWGGGAGGITWGWTIASPSCIIGAGGLIGSVGGYTRYGHLIAGANSLGGGGYFGGNGSTNYWGVANYGGSGGANISISAQPESGRGGVSGGGGGTTSAAQTSRIKGGSGGSGLAGGGGSALYAGGTTGAGGGNGGNGFNIQTGQITLGGLGSFYNGNVQGSGGGGGGTAGSGTNASANNGGYGGLGGGGGGGGATQGGAGGAGILYLYY